MVVNAVAPWEGQLIWVGTPNGGVSQQNGQEWKSVEFALKYIDMRLQEKHIVFSAFGLDIVNRILSFPIGTHVRVTWSPDARSAQQQDGSVKWYGKFSAFGITNIQQTATQVAAQPAPQGYPAATPAQPAPVYQPAPAYPAYPAQPQQAYRQPAPQQFAPPASPAYQELTKPEQDDDLPAF